MREMRREEPGPLTMLLAGSARLFDALEERWDRLIRRRTLGALLVVSFLGSLVLIELNRHGLLPAPLGRRLTTNHFGAVAIAFTLLLYAEVLALVFALARSVAVSVGKQFEFLSLILLRKAFIQFGEFGEPIEWRRVVDSILEVLADVGGALLIFVVVGLYYRVQRHQPITADERERAGFVAAKKLVALALLVAFALLGIPEVRRYATGAPDFAFFEAFFTVLIFSDILIVLISRCYSSTYHVVFRNSGFAAATIIIRLALTAPPFMNVLLGLGGAIFALGLSLAYNNFAPTMPHGRTV